MTNTICRAQAKTALFLAGIRSQFDRTDYQSFGSAIVPYRSWMAASSHSNPPERVPMNDTMDPNNGR
jgi:hypothetical protein